jgi:FkbM family methyltransferase
MLIKGDEVADILNKHGINVRGVLHIGAHELEERPFYNNTLNVVDDDIVWVDANPELVSKATSSGHKNVYCGAISADEKELDFKISNNGQSSSLLDFGLHKQHYPWIHYVNTIKVKTETLGSFFNRNNLDGRKYNFWNLDIQGVEYDVLRSATEFFAQVDAIYTEINTAEVYKGCGLLNEIDDLLTSYGFTRIRTEMTGAQWGDALYIKG